MSGPRRGAGHTSCPAARSLRSGSTTTAGRGLRRWHRSPRHSLPGWLAPGRTARPSGPGPGSRSLQKEDDAAFPFSLSSLFSRVLAESPEALRIAGAADETRREYGGEPYGGVKRKKRIGKRGGGGGPRTDGGGGRGKVGG